MLNGIICINKPEGFTSFDVIAKMRGILKMKKLGHSGTLDPMATGVLPVFAGGATKAISIIPETGKSYRAGFKFGIVTDTYDTTGKIIEETDFSVSTTDVEQALTAFRGEITQLPPMYSAVQVDGKRLYDLARKGIEVERPSRQVEVSRLELIQYDEKTGMGILEISCSKGTYIRSIIHDMGQNLKCGAAMTSLERTSSNGFSVDECVTLEQLEKLRDEDRTEEIVKPVESLFKTLPSLYLSEKKTTMYKNGVKLMLDRLPVKPEQEKFRVYGADKCFIGIAQADRNENVLRVLKNLSGDGK
ncbi:MAG: tRNA pseudouridine(55) synthase TruB [Oscillospiraceae bacterium]|nr:tRNA pseudouridine(55) synthase TruB [Oscillospiraceae bacterium]